MALRISGGSSRNAHLSPLSKGFSGTFAEEAIFVSFVVLAPFPGEEGLLWPLRAVLDAALVVVAGGSESGSVTETCLLGRFCDARLNKAFVFFELRPAAVSCAAAACSSANVIFFSGSEAVLVRVDYDLSECGVSIEHKITYHHYCWLCAISGNDLEQRCRMILDWNEGEVKATSPLVR
jgi:hypothetical protein